MDKTDRYVAMDQAKANNECSARKSQSRSMCPKCESPIFLHCLNCKIQITGCTCTEIDRFGTEAEGVAQIYERMAERMGEEEARKQMRKAGLWIPGLKGEI